MVALLPGPGGEHLAVLSSRLLLLLLLPLPLAWRLFACDVRATCDRTSFLLPGVRASAGSEIMKNLSSVGGAGRGAGGPTAAAWWLVEDDDEAAAGWSAVE